jgi:uncharacterized protein (TIGR02391 family)
MKTEKKSNKDRGRLLLSAMKERGEAMLKGGSVDPSFLATWSTNCANCVEEIFGEGNRHVHQFQDVGFSAWSADDTFDPQQEVQERRDELNQRLSVLRELIALLEIEENLSPETVLNAAEYDFWSLLNEEVVKIAKGRFDAGHYADCVEATLKELNSVMKALVKKAGGKEMDGADLMHTALSPRSPIIVLDDLGTDSGRSEQAGYMEIFAGAMTGIRNPKAHENRTITKKRAIHHLFLASLLFNRLEERTNLK